MVTARYLRDMYFDNVEHRKNNNNLHAIIK